MFEQSRRSSKTWRHPSHPSLEKTARTRPSTVRQSGLVSDLAGAQPARGVRGVPPWLFLLTPQQEVQVVLPSEGGG